MKSNIFTQRLARQLIAAALIVCAVAVPAMAASGVVNINQADVETLQLLPRVGPSVAQRIVDFRKENGKFTSKEDLLQVRGIGDKTFELIEPYISTDGASTLTEKVRVPRTTPADEGGGKR